jgi:hypothetical protein
MSGTTMEVQYDEGSAALQVEGVGRVERGTPATVSRELGEKLVEQGWREVKPRAAKKKSTSKTGAKPRRSNQ